MTFFPSDLDFRRDIVNPSGSGGGGFVPSNAPFAKVRPMDGVNGRGKSTGALIVGSLRDSIPLLPTGVEGLDGIVTEGRVKLNVSASSFTDDVASSTSIGLVS